MPAAVVAALAVIALVAVTATEPATSRMDRPTEASGVELLRREIDTMVAAGVPIGDPKLLMLQAELADMRLGALLTPPPEPGVDLSRPSGTRDVAAEGRDARLWDHGAVQCEVVPPDLLTAEEIEGASCSSEPQPDGSSLYVARRPDGTEHAVRFGIDGSVTRER